MATLKWLRDFLAFRLLPFVLVLGVFWSVWQATALLSAKTTQNADIERERDNFNLTATMIAPLSKSNADGQARGKIKPVRYQFATSTPEPSSGGFVVSTPDAMPSSTPPPSATPVPNLPATAFIAPTFFPAGASDVVEIAGTAVPTPAPLIPRDYELINILLLGSDEEVVDDNTIRTDTMIIVSINTQTKTVAMLGLPRDLFVYVPTPTMTRLNTVYGIGESFGWSGGGFGLLRQTIFYNFGVNVHYYAKVNFSGFETIIDTLGGIEMVVDCDYQNYYPVDDIDLTRPIEENYYMRTLPIGYYKFDGFDALWYARIRNLTDDFDRVRRQQLMLRAIFRAGVQSGTINNLPTLWGELTEVVETDIPFDVVLGLIPIALQIDPLQVEDFRLIRTYHTTPWQPTSGALAGQAVQVLNYEPIRDLLVDFYQPPTSSQIDAQSARVAVYNGTENENWDIVAAEVLRNNGINAVALGTSPNGVLTNTLLDQVGEDKGSPVPTMLKALNLTGRDVTVLPNASREYDYELIVGENFQSCTSNVLPIENP